MGLLSILPPLISPTFFQALCRLISMPRRQNIFITKKAGGLGNAHWPASKKKEGALFENTFLKPPELVVVVSFVLLKNWASNARQLLHPAPFYICFPLQRPNKILSLLSSSLNFFSLFPFLVAAVTGKRLVPWEYKDRGNLWGGGKKGRREPNSRFPSTSPSRKKWTTCHPRA